MPGPRTVHESAARGPSLVSPTRARDDDWMKYDRLDELLGLLDNNTCMLEVLQDELLGESEPERLGDGEATP